MFKILFSLCLMLGMAAWFSASYAQTLDLGQPRSWRGKLDNSQVPTAQMPRADIAPLVAQDAINDAQKLGPWRFGYSHAVSLNTNNSGVWQMLPTGDRIWRLRIESRNALSMNVLFDQFELAEGAFLHIYSDDLAQVNGAYTAANNNADRVLGTSPIKGDAITVELYQPADSRNSHLSIGTVVHGYRDVQIYADNLYKDLNDAGKCNLDVNCPLGNGWQNQINSVALIVVGGSGFCTGALVNNTANDGTPYFLTANHCTSGENVATWVFRFNWDSPNPVCAQNAASTLPPTPYNEVNGSTLRANRAGSDFALLQLNSIPSGDIYYAGWDRSGSVPSGAVTAIHHPSGDVKKISRENNPISQVTWQSAQCWQIANWDNGTTEGGSSGSPLFDNNQRIIGQLYGGGAACSGLINNNQPDNYGRFDISWATGTTNATRLSNWLDPLGTNPTFIDGFNPNTPQFAQDASTRAIGGVEASYCNQNTISPVATIRNSGSDTLTSVTINYGIQGGTNNTFNWTGSLATNVSATVALPSITANTGTNTLYIFTTMPNGVADPNNNNDTTRTTFEVISGGYDIPFTILPDCYASETSWKVFNSNNIVLAQGGPYSDAQNPAAIVNQLCLPAGCYTLKVYDSYGDGMRGNYGFPNCTINGDFFVVDLNGDTLVNLNVPNSNFGDSTTHNFCITAPSAPTAAFSSNRTTVCQNGSVTFNNQSTGGTSYQWTFQGGNPASSTATSPSVTYANPGTYSVTLTATNSLGSDTEILTNTITVAANNLASNSNNNGSTISTNPSGGTAPYSFSWSNGQNGGSISPTASGNYTVTITDAAGCQLTESFNFTLVNIQQFGRQAFSANLQPNPAQNYSQLVLQDVIDPSVQIQIFSTTGQLVQQLEASTSQNGHVQYTINTAELPAGLYFLQISSPNHLQTLKLVKQ